MTDLLLLFEFFDRLDVGDQAAERLRPRKERVSQEFFRVGPENDNALQLFEYKECMHRKKGRGAKSRS